MAEPALPRLVVLASGRGSNYQALFRAQREGWLGGQIAAVISDRPEAGVLDLAAADAVDAVCLDRTRFSDRHRFESTLAETIDSIDPAFVLMAGFMRVMGASWVDHYAGRLINIHPSLLPRHRGLNTHDRALAAGDSQHGASVHFVVPKLDAGPVLAQVEITIEPGDNAERLAERLLPLEHRLYPACVALLTRGIVEYRHETIHLQGRRLSRPLLLDVDLDDRGRVDRP